MTLRTITVGDLIDLLKNEDENALVIFGADYGDRSHTEQALPLKGECETVNVKETGYSNSGFAIVDEDDSDFEDGDRDTYLVIR
jgi:hypothetical protein